MVMGNHLRAASLSNPDQATPSIGKELEPFGVAVTCAMPGAVKHTERLCVWLMIVVQMVLFTVADSIVSLRNTGVDDIAFWF